MKKKKNNIAITGANSYIGTNLINYFISRKIYVRAFCRDTKTLFESFPDNKYLEIRHYSFDDKLIDFSKINKVIHLAHERTNLSRKDFSVDSNIAACKNIINSALKYKIKNFVYISSLLAHANTKSQYGKSKFNCEKFFLNNNFCILRLGFVFGGIEKGLYKKLMTSFRSNSFFPIIFPNKIVSPIHVIDLLEILIGDEISKKTKSPIMIKMGKDIDLKTLFYHLAQKLCGKKISFLYFPSSFLYFFTYFLGYYFKIFNLLFERVAGLASLESREKEVKECNFILKNTEKFFDNK